MSLPVQRRETLTRSSQSHTEKESWVILEEQKRDNGKQAGPQVTVEECQERVESFLSPRRARANTEEARTENTGGAGCAD